MELELEVMDSTGSFVSSRKVDLATASPRIAILVLTFRAMLDARRNQKSTRTRSDLRRGDLRTGKRCEQPTFMTTKSMYIEHPC